MYVIFLVPELSVSHLYGCVKAHALQRESEIFEPVMFTYTHVIAGNFLEVIYALAGCRAEDFVVSG